MKRITGPFSRHDKIFPGDKERGEGIQGPGKKWWGIHAGGWGKVVGDTCRGLGKSGGGYKGLGKKCGGANKVLSFLPRHFCSCIAGMHQCILQADRPGMLQRIAHA